MSFQFLMGVTLGPHESWPPPWENPGYATDGYRGQVELRQRSATVRQGSDGAGQKGETGAGHGFGRVSYTVIEY